MISQWTDERLDRFATKVDNYIENSREREQHLDHRIDNLFDQIGRLIEALYLEVPNIKAEINTITICINELPGEHNISVKP